MAKSRVTLSLKSALKRKALQRSKYASLSVSEKLKLLDQLHNNASFLASLKPKAKTAGK
ncbi:MAG: hypothetical protein ABSG63_08320 [Spirochaetia bacterium]|jgi:hypothetical protein